VALTTTNPTSHMVNPGIIPRTSWCEASPGLHGVKPATTTPTHEEIKSTLNSKYANHVVHIFVSWSTLWVWNLFFQTKGRKYIKEFKNRALGIFGQK
jgi:hypothetical protein